MISDTITGLLPGRLRTAGVPLYLRYLGKRADIRHRRVSDAQSVEVRHPHVLLLVIDAFRFDATLDLPFAWSAGIAPSSWTFPSITSIHTAQYPHEHGSVAHTAPGDETYAMPVQTDDPLLPQAFERAGFETYTGLAFLTPFLAVTDWYQRHRVFPDVRAEPVLEAYRSWRRERDRTFAYVHLGDLHAPLDPPETYIEDHEVDMSLPNLPLLTEYTDSYDGSETCRYYREQRTKLYDAARSYLEDQLEEHLLPIMDETLILVAGDHGEAHWDHVDVDRLMTDSRPNYGVGHGGTPLDAVARVPVALSTPDSDVDVRGGSASLIDIPRTLLDLTIGDVPPEVPGRTWAQRIPAERVAVCEAPRYGVERKAAYRGREKVIESKADEVVVGATIDDAEVGDAFGTLDAKTMAELREHFVWNEPHRSAHTSEYVREQLEALGYT